VLLDMERSATCVSHFVSPNSGYHPFIPFLPLTIQIELVRLILLTAASAQSVRLVVALSEAGSSFRCEDGQFRYAGVKFVDRNVLILD
jgi:hypothetical protein